MCSLFVRLIYSPETHILTPQRSNTLKSISNKQLEQLNSFKSDLQQKQEEVSSASTDFNGKVQELWANLVADSIDEYNKTVSAAQDFVDQTQEEIQNYYDERSESWQSGEHGTSFNEWINQWDVSLEEIDMDSPSETDLPDFGAVGQLEDLPEEPN